MTTQYTATQQLLPSNVMADVLSSKVDVNKNADVDVFSNVLDNASKNYVDKSELKYNKSEKSCDYGAKTKNESANKHIDKNIDKESVNIKDKSTSLNESNKNSKELRPDNQLKNEDSSINIIDKEDLSVKDTLEEVNPEKTSEISNSLDIQKTIEQLIDEIKVNATALQESIAVNHQNNIEEASQNVMSTNKIAIEKLVANIEFDNIDLKNIKIDNIENLDVNSLQKLVSQIQADSSTLLAETEVLSQLKTKIDSLIQDEAIKLNVNDLVSQNDTLKVDLSNNSSITSEFREVDVNKKESVQLATNKVVVDLSRLTSNVEGLNDSLSENKLITPVLNNLDAKQDISEQSEISPRIKVSDEVLSQIKEAVSKTVENKDNTSSVKAKAIETMTNLQDTNTLLTESQSSSFENGNNSGLGQNSASETAVKLTVEANSFNSTVAQPTETFVNRLDAQLSARETSSLQNQSLNQSDILSQVSAKFEQLQQQAGSKVSIVLQPESLGRVSVEIMNSKDGIIAKMTTETQQVKELFDKNIESLKSTLSAQGVNVNNIKVECTHESTNNAMNFERDQFNQSFNNQQQGQNHANKSEQNFYETSNSDFATDIEDFKQDNDTNELKNTKSIIKHNGKIDYSV